MAARPTTGNAGATVGVTWLAGSRGLSGRVGCLWSAAACFENEFQVPHALRSVQIRKFSRIFYSIETIVIEWLPPKATNMGLYRSVSQCWAYATEPSVSLHR